MTNALTDDARGNALLSAPTPSATSASSPASASTPAPTAEISPRVPVPPRDFHPDDHAGLHKSMGEAFDEPGAQDFVRRIYGIVRKSHPDVHPKHVLETTRDAYHAVHYGLMHPYTAGLMVGHHARGRHRRAQETRHANEQPHPGGRGPAATTAAPAHAGARSPSSIAQSAAPIPGRSTI